MANAPGAEVARRTLMTSRSVLLGALLLALATPAAACGGAIDPGTASSSSSGSSPPPATTTTPDPGPPSTVPGYPPPSTTSGGWTASASGCADFTVFSANTNGRRFLVIQARKDELGIAKLGDTVTVDLANKAAGPSTAVNVDNYPQAPLEPPYCSDIGSSGSVALPTESPAVSGTVTFTIAGVGREGGSYAVTVKLQGVVVRNTGGSLEAIPDVTYPSIDVGWYPG